MIRPLAVALFACALCQVSVPTPADEPKPAGKGTDAERLSGVWLFEGATLGDRSDLMRVWESKVTVTGDGVALSKLMGHSKDLCGKLTLNPTTTPKQFDLALEKLDFAELGVKAELPAGTVKGIYKFDGDRLTLCFRRELDGKRPTEFAANKETYLLTLARAPKDFNQFPEEVTVRVTGPDGKPAAGVPVAHFMSLMEPQGKKDTKKEWELSEVTKTGGDGTVRVKYERCGSVIARDAERKWIGFATTSPASLAGGEVTVSLAPECRVSVPVACPELVKREIPLGWTNAYLLRDGKPIAMCDSKVGKLEFVAPPGIYTVQAYGENTKMKFVPVAVPKDRSELAVAPIELKATGLVLLQGQPAPEFEGVVGWKGEKVKLADQKGKYVLVEFWGYWCGPCVGAMPVLIELHEKFADKGLVIVGVHRDIDGEVTTAAQLDEKVAKYKADIWKGKDMPFPSALVSGKLVGEGEDARSVGAVEQYGVSSYPTTVLIDRAGKVVGKFHARDIKSASAEIEKLLAEKK